jgi:hypothetical protein
MEKIDRICAEINDLTDGWLSEARKTLDLALSWYFKFDLLHLICLVVMLLIFWYQADIWLEQ